MNGTLAWRVNGIEQTEGFRRFGIEDQAVGSFVLRPNEGENAVTFVVADDKGLAATKSLRVHGQEMIAKGPLIDGDLDDWNDPPVLRLRRNSAYPTNGFQGDVAIVWTTTHVYASAKVLDSTPFPKPLHEDDECERDAVELNFRFGGESLTQSLDPSAFDPNTTHRLLLSPGSEGPRRALRLQWATKDRTERWKPIAGAEVATKPIEGGYILEAAISLSELGLAEPPKAAVPFDVRLIDSASNIESSRKLSLAWNSTSSFASEQCPGIPPYSFGIAAILPDPTMRPKLPRVQLFGGRTQFASSPAATKDPAFLTPMPLEHEAAAARLPDWLELVLPFEGTHDLATGYGFESNSWTHQTIANPRSANDFFCIDVNMPIGTPVKAAAAGRIVQSGRRGDSYGNYVVIDHGGGFQSIYAHLDSLRHAVDLGEPETTVQQGEVIGLSGRSGTSFPHLHFGLHEGARASHSGANVGGRAVCPEPLGGYYGLRKGHILSPAS